MLQREGKNLLRIKLTPNYSYKGEINFAFGIEDDFRGHNSYAFKVGYTMKSINEYGAEWKSDIAIGREQLFHTEFYQPLGYMQQLYVKPSYRYMQRVDIVSRENIGIAMEGNEELEITRYGSSIAFGSYLGSSYTLEAALSHYQDTLVLNSFVDIGGGFYYPLNLDVNYQARPITFTFLTDSLDNLNFPTSGVKAQIRWTKELPSFGSDYDYEQVYLDFEKPINFGVHNFTTYLKFGKTYNINGETALAGSFSLGGLFNLSGYTPYALNDDNMALGVLKYRYELKNGGFFGSLNVPLYTGFSLEAGGTWENKEKPNYDIIRKSATIYAAADTFLGPFYVAYGYCDANEQAVYLYLGEKF
ncbi:MAG: BamA/TamA family outer membrane protein [Epsilonproteobacteria bacterium]|nr:BamA/TamA family outer membrane protein [Campylobacterota bacterium]